MISSFLLFLIRMSTPSNRTLSPLQIASAVAALFFIFELFLHVFFFLYFYFGQSSSRALIDNWTENSIWRLYLKQFFTHRVLLIKYGGIEFSPGQCNYTLLFNTQNGDRASISIRYFTFHIFPRLNLDQLNCLWFEQWFRGIVLSLFLSYFSLSFYLYLSFKLHIYQSAWTKSFPRSIESIVLVSVNDAENVIRTKAIKRIGVLLCDLVHIEFYSVTLYTIRNWSSRV